MDPQPKQPSADDADPDAMTSPAGVAGELEDELDEHGAEVGPPDDDA